MLLVCPSYVTECNSMHNSATVLASHQQGFKRKQAWISRNLTHPSQYHATPMPDHINSQDCIPKGHE